MKCLTCVCVLVGIACALSAGEPGATDADVQGTAPRVAAQPAAAIQSAEEALADSVVYKFGAVELPYVGDGFVEYDAEEKQWSIGFAAPEQWGCTHVGWSFSAGDDVPEALRKEGGTPWVASGALEASVTEGVLFVSVETDDGVYTFEFIYDDAIADKDLTYVQSADTGQLHAVGDRLGQAAQQYAESAADDCPGGSCSCTGKRSACCSEGFHPGCNCSGAGICRCTKNKKLTLQLLEVQEY